MPTTVTHYPDSLEGGRSLHNKLSMRSGKNPSHYANDSSMNYFPSRSKSMEKSINQLSTQENYFAKYVNCSSAKSKSFKPQGAKLLYYGLEKAFKRCSKLILLKELKKHYNDIEKSKSGSTRFHKFASSKLSTSKRAGDLEFSNDSKLGSQGFHVLKGIN